MPSLKFQNFIKGKEILKVLEFLFHSSYCYSVISGWPSFFFPHYPASSLLPTAVAQGFGHKTNSCTYRGGSRYLSRRNIQVFGIFCQHSHVRIESAHSRSYVILMSFLLWVTEKNLSALFCYLLGV